MSYLGLDIGTSGCKAVVFNMEGKELASAYREYPVTSESKGWAELDSLHTIDCCFDVIRQVNRQLQNDAVEALCISSQGEAFTPVDAAGNIIGNAMISSDARAAELSVSFSHEFGVERLYQITGHTAHPLFTLFKLLWLRNNRPQVWQNAHHFYCFEELMHLKLGIEPAISFPLAGRTMLFDVEKHEWSDEIANAIGLDTDKLARALPSGSYVGTIPATIAASLGFSLPVAVVAGGHDQTCAALGAGVVEPGICMYATGTVECFCPMFDKLTLSDELMNNNLCCYDFTLNGKYTTVAYSLTGGNILKWFRDEFGCTEKQQALASGTDAYSLLLAAMPNEPTNLLVLPYFSPSGTPYFDMHTAGAINGIRLNTTRAEIMKALLEGVALEMRLNLELMEASGMAIHTFIATGGGVRNDAWTQLKSDVLNRPVHTIDKAELGCFGAAMLACSYVSGHELSDLVRIKQFSKTFQPNPQKAAVYTQKLAEYRSFYKALKKN